MTTGAQAAAASSLRRFDAIREQTECVFARGTRLWGSDEWPPADFGRGVANFAGLLESFAGVPAHERPDGAVLEVADPAAGATVDALARTTREVLTGLSRLDPGHDRCMDRPIEDRAWWFTFAAQPFFVVTFAPCYGPDSSRYAFGLTATYLLFQTRDSFVRRWDRDSRIPPESRTRIRSAFAGAGRPYDMTLTLSAFEAHRYVKPDQLGRTPVKWWITEQGHD
jgi:hypothetical protein